MFKDIIVLKNADSWTSLGKMAALTPCTIKSSKESFQQFRKVAMEKEEREKARKLQLEAGREKSSTDKSGYTENFTFKITQYYEVLFWWLRDFISVNHSITMA